MNRNQVLLQVELSAESSALKKVDFCAPQSYTGAGFLSMLDMPRVAEEASIVNPADGKLLRALVGAQQALESISWSPDGRMMAFSSDRDGTTKIYIMDSNGEIQAPVSLIGGKAPAWSRSTR